jgi:hypothetical protein
MAAPAASPMGLEYSIHDGILRVVPAVDGYMIIRAVIGTETSGDDRLVLRTSHVTRASPLVLSVPDRTASLLVVLSPRPVAEDSVGNLAARTPARTQTSGAVTSSAGDPRLEIRIRLK